MKRATYVLGINSAYHESAACLLKNGRIIAAAEEERFNRVRHAKPARVNNPNELPWSAIRYCFKRAGVKIEDISHIGYSLDPKERLARNSAYQHPYEVTPNDFGTKNGEQLFYERILEVEKILRQAGFRGEFHFLNHHDCHAASAFFVSPFQDAGILVVDGIGEFESTTIYTGRGNRIERTFEINYPNSLGFLWEKISKFLGFSEYDSAKVMGLAAYGDPSIFRAKFESLLHLDERVEGNFEVNDSICRFRSEDFSALENLFGVKKRNDPIKTVDNETKDYADIAAALQEATEKIILALALKIRKEGYSNLCLAGGVALNCVANGRLIQESLFKEIFIQPAANDAGTAIGAVYYIWNQLLGNSRSYIFDSPYLGPQFSNEEIREALDKHGLIYTKPENIEHVAAKLIAEGKIVAWFQGRMELGPRALGNRSILADPRNPNIASELNSKVKYREPFRPLCPSVLEEEAAHWFDLGSKLMSPAKYMISTYKVQPSKRDLIPAVVHVDGTGRIQSVSKEGNPKYHALISEFHRLTGVPIVLNTSFNVREPIICTPQEAVRTFLSTRIDYLAIGDFLVSKADNEVVCPVPDIPLKEYFERLR